MGVFLAVLIGGFASGMMASLLGVGGAVITTPLIRGLGATPIAAVGSTVPAILPGAVAGSLRYQKEGYIVWRIALTCGASGMSFAILGGWVAGEVPGRWLMVATALLVGWSGTSLLRQGRRSLIATDDVDPADAVDDAPEPGALDPTITPRRIEPAAVALGICAGFLAGLLGIGGGVILTPGLTLGLKLPVKHAIATSLVAVSMMSVTALATHIYLGHVNWRYALPLVIGVVPGARVGARITVGSSEARVRLVAGVLLTAVAGVYLVTELAGIG